MRLNNPRNDRRLTLEQRHNLVISTCQAARLDIQSIWFHGSRALGTHHNRSDWDYLIVLKDPTVYCADTYLALVLQVMALHPFPGADVQVAYSFQTQREGSLGYWVMLDGVKVFNTD